jgi:hypothetical protein
MIDVLQSDIVENEFNHQAHLYIDTIGYMYQNSKNIEKITFFTLTSIDVFVALSSFDIIKKGTSLRSASFWNGV